jgi:ABC-2 type transport system ATP-binding protein
MRTVISAQGLTKRYGKSTAIENVNFSIEQGHIVGLIGPNGSGKTTTLKAILGLIAVDGEITVLGLDPHRQRNELMQSIAFIADAAILPRWIRVSEVIDFVAGVHPKFQRTKAEQYIAKTKLKPDMKVKDLSKGMVVQLHLALIMAIDAKLLVLDEPTLGLDILHRKQFYRSLLEDYFDAGRTIIVSTHQIEEIEHVVSDLLFIKDGHIVLHESTDQLAERFAELEPRTDCVTDAHALGPVDTRTVLGRQIMLFDGVDKSMLAALGEVRIPALADVFVAVMQGEQK